MAVVSDFKKDVVPLLLALMWEVVFMYWAIDHLIGATAILTLITTLYFIITNKTAVKAILTYGKGIVLGFIIAWGSMILLALIVDALGA